MKNPILLLIFCALLYSCIDSTDKNIKQAPHLSEQQKQADIDSVKKLVENTFQHIWSDLDSSQLKKYHTADFTLLENGTIWNNDSIINYLISEQKRVAEHNYQRLNRFEFLKSAHNQTSIWVAYNNYGTWIKGNDTLGVAHWLESAVAVKEDSVWKIQQLHSTPVEE